MDVPKKQNVSSTKGASVDTVLLKFIEATITSYVKFGGALVSEDQYQERLSICSGCDLLGTVKIPLPLAEIKTIGCKGCGCPSSTKPRALKYFSFKQLRIIPATCPHKDGNKWEEVDKKYLPCVV